jgi:Tol biopolymer transport system component
MISDDRFERLLVNVLAEVAPSQEPDRLVPETLRAARRVRRWPRWLALIKEPPMRISSRVAVGSPTFRLVSIMAMTLALLLAVGAAVVAGASLLPSPAPQALLPYGPAANGSLVYEQDGDIYLADALGQDARAIITGPEQDGGGPTFSHDGTRFAFMRTGPGATQHLMVARTDGTHIVQLTGPIDWGAWSPDDTTLAVHQSLEGRPTLAVVAADGSGSRTLGLGAVEPAGYVDWRPTEGQELIFTAHPTAGSTDLGFYAIHPDGTGLRRIGDIRTGESQVAPLQISLQNPVLSPDGSTVAYWSWESKDGGEPGSYMHIRDLVTGQDRRLWLDPASEPEDLPHFSPDGQSLLFTVYHPTSALQQQLVVARLDGSQPATPIGPEFDYNNRTGEGFSPDGTKVFLTMNAPAGTTIIDVATGVGIGTSASIPTLPDWQRLAP